MTATGVAVPGPGGGGADDPTPVGDAAEGPGSDGAADASGPVGGGEVPEAAALRRALRGWLDTHLTEEVVEAGRAGPEDAAAFDVLREWNRHLADDGWAAPSWPTGHGGRAAGVDAQLAYHEEMVRAGAPGPVNVIGVSNIAPAIMAFGTEEQQRRFLRPMLRGDEIWCQGMSEPDAGSDLAGLRTRGDVGSETVVVNGQKTWTSLGQRADWCQLYVRTDPRQPRHRGISCLLVDMRLPGIEVRPLRTMAGDVVFSELFFVDVEVPVGTLLGPLHGGWQVAMNTLSHERAGVARLHLGLSRTLDSLVADARAAGRLDDPRHRQRLAAVYAEIACMRWTTTRALQRSAGAPVPPAVQGSGAKLQWSRVSQQLAELAVNVLGLDATTGTWGHNLAASRALSIAGGTTEINRTIVAEHGLGLPR